MPEQTIIRKITADDKAELLKMMVDFYNSPALLHHTPKSVLSRVIDDCAGDDPFIEGFVAVTNGKICAYTMVSLGYSTEYGGRRVMIEDLYVLPSMQGKKLGSMLLEHVEKHYTPAAVQLRLEVAPDNTRAISVYEKRGYTEINYKQMGKELK